MPDGSTSRARARANIALAKYWGKLDSALNLPAVPSVSLTIDVLVTETDVTLDASLREDTLSIDGAPAPPLDVLRATELLDRVRSLAGATLRARIESRNDFPTASGLASSASGFAALCAAAARAYGLALAPEQLSALARRSSASAARSVLGGFVEMAAGIHGDDTLAARPLAPAAHWDVAMLVAITTHARKHTSSRDGMIETARTSPYYSAWLGSAPLIAREVRDGILARDIERVGRAMEASTFAMHASAMAAVPSIRYALPETVVLLDAVAAMQARHVPAYATMDAGPHVKVLCEHGSVEDVRRELEATGAASQILVGRPGTGIE